MLSFGHSFLFFFNDTATTEIYTLSLHDALPILDAKSTIAARIESRSLYVGKTTEMRLPRQDTSMSLPAEHPRDALRRDEALLDSIGFEPEPLVRWWTASSPAVVVGLGLHHRLTSIVDIERCKAAGIANLERRAGRGALILEGFMLCG